MVVFAILAIISSGYDYAAEKLFYRAMKTESKIAISPVAALRKMMLYVESNLQKILKRYPQSKVAKEAHFALAEFYLNHKNYVGALETLYDIIKVYSNDKSVLSKAHFLKGNVFEQQNQWNKALREYTILRDKYTDTPLGLGILVYIGDYYQQQKRYAEADKAYKDAVRFYRKIERQGRGKARGYAAANLLIRTYMELEQYEQAGEAVEEAIHLYPKLLPLAQQLANIDLIFIKELNKPEKAVEMYHKIKTKTDDPNLTQILDEKIKVLEAQK